LRRSDVIAAEHEHEVAVFVDMRLDLDVERLVHAEADIAHRAMAGHVAPDLAWPAL